MYAATGNAARAIQKLTPFNANDLSVFGRAALPKIVIDRPLDFCYIATTKRSIPKTFRHSIRMKYTPVFLSVIIGMEAVPQETAN